MSTQSSRRFIVIGPGATGGAIAVELARHGSDVLLVARGAEYDAISAHGLIFHTPEGSEAVQIPVANGPEQVTLTPDDVFIIATKVQDVEPALRAWAWQPVAAADGTVTRAARTIPLVTVQNGFNAERVALRWFSTVYAGTILCSGGKTTVGEISNYGRSKSALLWLGRYPSGTDAEVEAIAAELNATGRIGVQVVDEIQGFKAYKLAYNTVNSVEPVFAPSELRDELVDRLKLEALDVFAAHGIKPVDVNAEGVSTLDTDTLQGGEVAGQPRQGNSTFQSFVRGSEVESDYLNGEVVLLARLAGVAAPLNEALQLLIQEAVAEGRQPGALGDDVLKELLG